MNKLVQYSAKLSQAGMVAVALLVLGGASPAFATHETGHDEIARGKIGALEERVWSCENDFAPCESIVGPQGEQGPGGDAGSDGPLAGLECDEGDTVAFVDGVWVCSDGGTEGRQPRT